MLRAGLDGPCAAWAAGWQPCPRHRVGAWWTLRSLPTLAILWLILRLYERVNLGPLHFHFCEWKQFLISNSNIAVVSQYSMQPTGSCHPTHILGVCPKEKMTAPAQGIHSLTGKQQLLLFFPHSSPSNQLANKHVGSSVLCMAKWD